MDQSINRLKECQVSKAGEGRHADGGYLFLVVRGASKSWVVRGPRTNGKRIEAGLGSVDQVSLAQARRKRDELLAQVRDGLNPIEEKRKAIEAQARRKTFAQVAQDVITKNVGAWKVSELRGKAATLGNWQRDLLVVCAPIAAKCIDEVDLDDVRAIVMPIYDAKHDDTARALLNRLETVFDYAFVSGWRTAANPATSKIWKLLAPKRAKVEAEAEPHHAAVPWQDAPAALAKIRASDVVSARLAEFVILTATRSQEARGARWDEIDLEAKVWTVPASRMKMSRDHEVPLSDAAIELLGRVERTGEFVFVGGRGELAQAEGDAMSHQGLWAFVKRATGASVHGFRSVFKNWADNNGVADRLSEKCLAHLEKDKVKRAYATDQLTEVRRPIMQAWAAFLEGGVAPDNVVPLRREAA
jgi:integrase